VVFTFSVCLPGIGRSQQRQRAVDATHPFAHLERERVQRVGQAVGTVREQHTREHSRVEYAVGDRASLFIYNQRIAM